MYQNAKQTLFAADGVLNSARRIQQQQLFAVSGKRPLDFATTATYGPDNFPDMVKVSQCGVTLVPEIRQNNYFYLKVTGDFAALCRLAAVAKRAYPPANNSPYRGEEAQYILKSMAEIIAMSKVIVVMKNPYYIDNTLYVGGGQLVTVGSLSYLIPHLNSYAYMAPAATASTREEPLSQLSEQLSDLADKVDDMDGNEASADSIYQLSDQLAVLTDKVDSLNSTDSTGTPVVEAAPVAEVDAAGTWTLLGVTMKKLYWALSGVGALLVLSLFIKILKK